MILLKLMICFANKCTQEFVFISENHFKNFTTIASTLLVLCVVSHINFVLVIGLLKDHYKRKRFRTAVDNGHQNSQTILPRWYLQTQ